MTTLNAISSTNRSRAMLVVVAFILSFIPFASPAGNFTVRDLQAVKTELVASKQSVSKKTVRLVSGLSAYDQQPTFDGSVQTIRYISKLHSHNIVTLLASPAQRNLLRALNIPHYLKSPSQSDEESFHS